MTSIPERIGGSPPRLENILVERLRRSVSDKALTATVALDAGTESWTLRIHNGRLSLSHGMQDPVDTTIRADASVIAGVLSGDRSGIAEFLEGRLVARGNLALALRLYSLVEGSESLPGLPRAGSARAGGIRTSYIEAGQGRPVILLHGLGATNASLLPTFQALLPDHRVVAPDLPGFGDSDKPIKPLDAGFYAAWLTAFMDELGLRRADLVGNSMGGRIAIEAGLRTPQRVGSIVLLAPSPAFIKRREWVRVVRFIRPELALLPTPLPHRYVVGAIKAMFARPSRLPDTWYDAAADEFLRVFSTVRGRISFVSAARQIYLEEPRGDDGFWDRLPALHRPALFVWGENDRLVPAQFSRHAERALPDATSVVFEDCGHVPQFEHPHKTNALIRDFLATSRT